jgi:tRNA(Ile)-lysidine synthase
MGLSHLAADPRMTRSREHTPKFLTELKAGVRCCNATGQSLLVAVSGGADSVALLCGLLELRSSLNLTVRAAHLNHCLRGADSNDDAAWVSRLCERRETPCDVESVRVGPLAEQRGRGIEETAREARYEFLRQVAERHHCAVIAVAHTADDQAETVLHHILRGTGLTGLRGMEWSRSLAGPAEASCSLRVIRPMLSIWRTDVEEFLADIGQDFRDDRTNQDVSLTRNRLRHVREHLCQLAEQAAGCEEALTIAADALLDTALLDHSEAVARLRCDELAKHSRPLIREVLVRLWQRQKWPSLAMTFRHWDDLAQSVRAPAGSVTQLPGGITARRRAKLLAIERLRS